MEKRAQFEYMKTSGKTQREGGGTVLEWWCYDGGDSSICERII